MKEQKSSPLGYYMLGICALFLAGFLMMVILGAEVYRQTTDSQSRNNQTRALLSYLATVVRANDMSGAIHVREGAAPDGRLLLVAEDGSGYASRIYPYKEYLVEDYGEAEGDFDPEHALKIGKIDTFAIDWSEEQNSLRITANNNDLLIYLRSAGGVTK